MTEPRPRKSPHVPTLTGDDSGTFDIALLKDAYISIKKNLKNNQLSDDFVFQSYLRYQASIYYFLGGAHFARHLANLIRRKEYTIARWLNGEAAPTQNVRVLALAKAIDLVHYIELQRRSGATLWDVVSHQEE